MDIIERLDEKALQEQYDGKKYPRITSDTYAQMLEASKRMEADQFYFRGYIFGPSGSPSFRDNYTVGGIKRTDNGENIKLEAKPIPVCSEGPYVPMDNPKLVHGYEFFISIPESIQREIGYVINGDSIEQDEVAEGRSVEKIASIGRFDNHEIAEYEHPDYEEFGSELVGVKIKIALAMQAKRLRKDIHTISETSEHLRWLIKGKLHAINNFDLEDLANEYRVPINGNINDLKRTQHLRLSHAKIDED